MGGGPTLSGWNLLFYRWVDDERDPFLASSAMTSTLSLASIYQLV